jgi:predicted exporter
MAVALWLVAMASCVLIILEARFTSDMSAFLPRSPSATQRVLVDQVQNGAVSRLILLAIEGAPPEILANLSKDLAKRLREEPAFAAVNNGDEAGFAQDREFLWRNRYLLSPDVVADRFSAAGLRRSLEKDLQLLNSDLGGVVKRSLGHDPSGEILTLADQFAAAGRPHSRDGVWLTGDDRRAVLVAQTRAPGSDLEAQAQALAMIEAAFAAARNGAADAGGARLLLTGPPVFAVHTRATIEEDVTRLSALATIAVLGMMLFAYRSLRTVLFGFLPVASGALAGIAAVRLGFGFVHEITLGFGVTLLGESVDYAVYLFSQTVPGDSADRTLARIWPTLRLGVLTSVAGYAAMLFSGFTGFAQLGLLSIVGLLAAAAVTRWILPALLPQSLAGVGLPAFAAALDGIGVAARRLRLLIPLLTIGAAVLLILHRGGFWQQDISALSPVPAADERLDRELRHDIGGADVRYMVVVSAAGEQQALAASERLYGTMERLVAEKALGGFDAPSRYLPSDAVQRARQAALPGAESVREHLEQALAGLPFRPDVFAPFIADVRAAKSAPLLTRDALPPGWSLKLDSLLFRRHGQWTGVLPLQDVSNPEVIANAIAAAGEPEAVFVDLKAESDRLLQSYQREAATLALVGSVVVVALLAAALRSLRRVFFVTAPLAVAVVVTTALLTFAGRQLSIFHLVGLLLVVAVGSNYCLFFERQRRAGEERARMLASLVLANLCTVAGFGFLSFSRVPVLHDIGATVATGTFLSLILAAVLTADGPPARRNAPAAGNGAR